MQNMSKNLQMHVLADTERLIISIYQLAYCLSFIVVSLLTLNSLKKVETWYFSLL